MTLIVPSTGRGDSPGTGPLPIVVPHQLPVTLRSGLSPSKMTDIGHQTYPPLSLREGWLARSSNTSALNKTR